VHADDGDGIVFFGFGQVDIRLEGSLFVDHLGPRVEFSEIDISIERPSKPGNLDYYKKMPPQLHYLFRREEETHFSKQRLGIFPETRLAAPRVRHAALELGPKGRAMTPDAGVDEFVQDDIVGQVRRQDGEKRVELDAAGA
jgi:hypothetical protein